MPIQLTESIIQSRVGEQSFERGLRYFCEGRIVDPRRQGDALKAKCLGTSAPAYRLEVTLGPAGIASGSCSCPVGAGGYCKHVAALLLAWVRQPEVFREVEELETVLNRYDKAELIALIRRMIARVPDLEELLELPVVVGGQPSPVNPDIIRRQARRAFSGADYNGWSSLSNIAGELGGLVDLGNDYAKSGDWRSADAIYRTVADEVLDNYASVHDEEGELVEVVDRCIDGFGECLRATADPVERETLLRALFEAYRWDVEFGGIDMGAEAPRIILEQAAAEERHLVAGWVREALPPGSSWSDGYRRQVYGGFLLELEEGRLDDAAFLNLCGETQRWGDLVRRLLELARVDEAVTAAREVNDYDLLSLTDIFVGNGRADLAERLVRERAQVSQDSRLVEWLKRRAVERGDLTEALALAEQLFWQRPSVAGYREQGDLAGPLGRWEDLRVAILARLAEKDEYGLLTEIYLEEGDIDRALVAVERTRIGFPWDLGHRWLYLKVAEAAMESRPREAIRIFAAEAEQLVKAQGRGNYNTAAGYLQRVRDLYQRLGETAVWGKFIADLRERYRRLPALRDELNKAGL